MHDCIALHSLLAFGPFRLRPGRFGVAPDAVQPFCASQVVGGLPLFMHTSRTQATTESQQNKPQRASHKPVCLVPESLGEHLCLRYMLDICALLHSSQEPQHIF